MDLSIVHSNLSKGKVVFILKTLRLLRFKDGSFEISYLFIASTDVSDAALERKTDLRGRITSSLHPVEPVVEDWETIVSVDISCARISLFGKED